MNKCLGYCPALLAIAMIAAVSGCSMCCGPDDFNYGTYGGLHPRSDMQHGRVGSVFSDPAGTAGKLVPYTDPADPQPGGGGAEDLGDPKKIDDSDLPNPNDQNKGKVDQVSYEAPVNGTVRKRAKPAKPTRRQPKKPKSSVLGGTRFR